MSNLRQQTSIDFKKYKRFFAFGCSFTYYFWPTWADIIATQIPYSQNWGQTGGGNGYILNSVMECHQRHQFCESDLVMIMWTSVAREDRYMDRRWRADGNIYSQNYYSPEMVKKMACDRGYYIRDCAYVTAVTSMLKHTGCDFDYLSMVPLNNVDGYNDKKNAASDVDEIYKDMLNLIRPSMFETVFNYDWWCKSNVIAHYWGNKPYKDYHPLPQYHFEYLLRTYPNSIYNSSAVDFVNNHTKEIQQHSVLTKQVYDYHPNKEKVIRL